ncbi:hypothetical protein [Thalassospira sp. ER-Se-21-Dark]|uniref:hypothetical protein n=1 Tax=Thalassospira sp. ER-Se-21-Dark TaxID=2585190 RepID=UPI001B313393|nr:hypothetical protein [Thalassospira sp. ER-Se-21-Dark]MBP3124476.1 hypothetical protein [Thalassospira sp. ER-Se-21-Dark]
MGDREAIIQNSIEHLRKKQATQGWQAVLVLLVLLGIGIAYIDGFLIGLIFFGCLAFLFCVVMRHYEHERKAMDAQIKSYEDELDELIETRRFADLKEKWQSEE